jgi:hypothetical protein
MADIGDQKAEIKIFNMSSYEVYSSVTIGQALVVINLENQKSGNYLASITINGHLYTQKIILKKQ